MEHEQGDHVGSSMQNHAQAVGTTATRKWPESQLEDSVQGLLAANANPYIHSHSMLNAEGKSTSTELVRVTLSPL